MRSLAEISADEFAQAPLKRNDLEALGLQKGDTMVNLGFGTGLNCFPLQQQCGPHGKITAVDLTAAVRALASTAC